MEDARLSAKAKKGVKAIVAMLIALVTICIILSAPITS